MQLIDMEACPFLDQAADSSAKIAINHMRLLNREPSALRAITCVEMWWIMVVEYVTITMPKNRLISGMIGIPSSWSRWPAMIPF